LRGAVLQDRRHGGRARPVLRRRLSLSRIASWPAGPQPAAACSARSHREARLVRHPSTATVSRGRHSGDPLIVPYVRASNSRWVRGHRARAPRLEDSPAFTRGSAMAKTGALASESVPELKPSNRRAARPELASRMWAVVLAGGEGCRLKPLVRRLFGDDRPKQYAPLLGSTSLLRQTLDRVGRLIPAERTIVVSQYDHSRYLDRELCDAAAPPVRLQPA